MSHRLEASITGCNRRKNALYEWKETLNRLRQSHGVRSGSITSLLEQFQLISCRNLHDFICEVIYEHLTVGGPTVGNCLELLQLSRFECQ